MQYKLTNSFVTLAETEGMLYALNGDIEVATDSSQEPYTGFTIKQGEYFPVAAENNLRARAISGRATLNVSPVTKAPAPPQA